MTCDTVRAIALYRNRIANFWSLENFDQSHSVFCGLSCDLRFSAMTVKVPYRTVKISSLRVLVRTHDCDRLRSHCDFTECGRLSNIAVRTFLKSLAIAATITVMSPN